MERPENNPNVYFFSPAGPPRKPRRLHVRLWASLRAAWLVFRTEWRGEYWEA